MTGEAPLTNPTILSHSFLRGVLEDFCGPLDDATFQEIKPQVEWRRLEAGELLFDQGDPGDSIYLVAGGRLEAFTRDERGRESVLGQANQGESVGEMALLTDSVRTAAVRATRHTVALRISAAGFRAISHRDPAILLTLLRILSQRLHGSYASAPRRRVSGVLALVTISTGFDSEPIVQGLLQQLGSLGRVARLDAAELDGAGGTAPARSLSERLGELEHAAELVLVTCPADRPQVAHRMIQRADRVLLLADAAGSAEPGPIELQVLDGLDSATLDLTLLLVHAHADGRPSGTSAWLGARKVRRHFHLRRDDDGDLARLARILTGNAVALVLGGGGARGFAHVGVLRALEELGVPVDLVCGTSIGAMVGASLAVGLSPRAIEAGGAFINRRNPFGDYTIPLLSAIRGRRFEADLRWGLGTGDIEDCRLPFLCVSSNLTGAEVRVHRRGPLWRAVRASTGMPGIMPPVLDNGELLVDGGIVNNLPVDVIRREYACRTIGVSLSAPDHSPHPGEEFPGFWRYVYHKYLRRTPGYRIPTFFGVIAQTTTLASHGKQQEDSALLDVLLSPPVRPYGLLDIRKYSEIVEVGYRYAMERAEELRRILPYSVG